MTINFTLIILLAALVTLIILLKSTISNINGNKLYKEFSILIFTFIIHISGLVLQILFSGTDINPIYFEYIAYIGGMNFSTSIFIMALTYLDEKKNVPKLKFMYIIPLVLLIALWTNDAHHLFYVKYSTILSESVFGPFLSFFTVYSYSLIIISFIILIVSSIRKSGFVSKQTALIILGLLFPASVNFIGVFNPELNVTVYATPILFTATSVCFYIAIFRLKALNIIPVAINTIVDTMTDGFIVISKDGTIVDVNKTCKNQFSGIYDIKENDNFFAILKETEFFDVNMVKTLMDEALSSKQNITKEIHIVRNEFDKYFEVDFEPVKSMDGKEYVALLILLRDITSNKKNMETMLKNESLVMLGELAGGVAHDINTPISAIKSGLLMIKDLHTSDDEKMLLDSMNSCADKIITLTNSLRNQIRNIGSNEVSDVNISTILRDVSIIINNELKKKGVTLNVESKDEIILKGNQAKLSQVVTNLVLNAIQAYESPGGTVNVKAYKENGNAVISVEDFAGGIPEYIRNSIGKNILTTKGVNGTGFGLYMAYSVIKGAFNGEITFDTETGKGTTFYITIPMK